MLTLLYSNITFYLTSVKPFYIGNIKVITNSPEPKSIPEFYNKAKGNIDIIPLIIPAISLEYSRECPYKNPDIMVFL